MERENVEGVSSSVGRERLTGVAGRRKELAEVGVDGVSKFVGWKKLTGLGDCYVGFAAGANFAAVVDVGEKTRMFRVKRHECSPPMTAVTTVWMNWIRARRFAKWLERAGSTMWVVVVVEKKMGRWLGA